jgi:hypothetical protein
VRLEELSEAFDSDLLCRRRVDSLRAPQMLVVQFLGHYRRGSRGKPDADFMRAKVAEALALTEPFCLLLDLRPLHYSWGDSILSLFQMISRFMDEPEAGPFPVVVVTSWRCRAALLSVCGHTEDSAREWHFRTLKEGLKAARAAAEKYGER